MAYVTTLIVRKEEVVDAVNLGCGCQPIPSYIIEEEEIIDTPKTALVIIDDIDFNPCRLKNKVICEYNKLLSNLECGVKGDILLILEEISLIEINEYLKKLKDYDRGIL